MLKENVTTLEDKLQGCEKSNQKLERLRDVLNSVVAWSGETAFPVYSVLKLKCESFLSNREAALRDREYLFRRRLRLHLSFWPLGALVYSDPRQDERYTAAKLKPLIRKTLLSVHSWALCVRKTSPAVPYMELASHKLTRTCA